MSSSTMIHGATIRRPKPQRTIAEAATSAPSQKPAGRERAIARVSARRRSRVSLAAKPNLVEQARDLGRLVALGGDPDVRRRLGDLADDGVADGLGACGLLERGHVCVGDAVEVV